MVFAAWLLVLAPASGQEPPAEASVGVPVQAFELVLPGSELVVAPVTLETPVVLRIADVHPHGEALRYDLIWYGLDPGEYDLRDFLARRDGGPTDDLPPLPIRVRSVLPAGRVLPNRIAPGEGPGLGGYRVLAVLAGLAWLAGLVAILRVGRRPAPLTVGGPARPRSLAERLRPLVERARQGELSRGERAELELALIGLWRRRLELAEAPAAQALARLREHPEAGPLLRALEDWLHRPDPPGEVDLGALLAPYEDLPEDALALTPPAPAPARAR